ncbi:HCLS1-associated protein X-1 [Polypterus senegalus]|uniref:HCLS1-associated protein X-1 n=1 Tax=Polypterus senegalus TaxID=55291 RepID=UPI001965568C|nr:HCLS1-associated protein X-1 [Polypterus senegalus]
MSVFDLFRRFFGFHGGGFHGQRRIDPFFEGMMNEDDDNEDGQDYGTGEDFRFGFNFGPGGRGFNEFFGFEEMFRDIDGLFQRMDKWDVPSREFEIPSIEMPAQQPSRDGTGTGRKGRHSLRDFMLKYPDSHLPNSQDESSAADQPHHIPGPSGSTEWPRSPFRRFEDAWRDNHSGPEDSSVKEDKVLDSQVSEKGLDDILRPPEPKVKSYFKSFSFTKVIAPDGTVEERRTVRDSYGNEEATVTRSKGGDSSQFTGDGKKIDPHIPDLQSDQSIFSEFFRGFFSSR